MIDKKSFKAPEGLVWLGFGLSVVALLAFIVLFFQAGAGVDVAMSILTVACGLLGMALSVWGMLRWVLLDTPKWLHYTSIGLSVVNVLIPIPLAVQVIVMAILG